jgi:hypothetical protein
VEACAEVFGGTSGDWRCSTRDYAADGRAYVDGWGDSESCDEPVADDFKLGSTYDCGAEGCSYSAYVSDHSCTQPNYCWSEDTSLACVDDLYESDDTVGTATTLDTSGWADCDLLTLDGCEIRRTNIHSCSEDDDHHQFPTSRERDYETIITFDPAEGDLTAEYLTVYGSRRAVAELIEPGRLRLWYGVHDDYICDSYWDIYDCPTTLVVRVSNLSDAGVTKGVAYDIAVTMGEY